MIEPIIEFKDESQAYECLKEWQTRLFLDDWIIKIHLVPLNEISLSGCVAENKYESALKCSYINIGLFTNDNKNDMIKPCHECILVHELLHLKLLLTDGASDTIDGQFIGSYEHALIEQMAKSLIMAKYNLTFDWFRNF